MDYFFYIFKFLLNLLVCIETERRQFAGVSLFFHYVSPGVLIQVTGLVASVITCPGTYLLVGGDSESMCLEDWVSSIDLGTNCQNKNLPLSYQEPRYYVFINQKRGLKISIVFPKILYSCILFYPLNYFFKLYFKKKTSGCHNIGKHCLNFFENSNTPVILE